MPRPLFEFVLPLLWLCQPALAAVDARTAEICDAAARRAAVAEDVPLDILRAITRVETGRQVGGQIAPWPWAVNLEGKGYWFATETEAKAYVYKVFKAGARSFDVGCFQVNYRWHGRAFRSIDAMFDPDENAAYAARFLRQLHAELGSWPEAAGAYHSRTQALATSYRQRFESTLAELRDDPPLRVATAPRNLMAAPGQPLFARPQASSVQRGSLGSLVPMGGNQTAFISFN